VTKVTAGLPFEHAGRALGDGSTNWAGIYIAIPSTKSAPAYHLWWIRHCQTY